MTLKGVADELNIFNNRNNSERIWRKEPIHKTYDYDLYNMYISYTKQCGFFLHTRRAISSTEYDHIKHIFFLIYINNFIINSNLPKSISGSTTCLVMFSWSFYSYLKIKTIKKKINNEKRCYITFQEKNYLALFLVSITLTTPF